MTLINWLHQLTSYAFSSPHADALEKKCFSLQQKLDKIQQQTLHNEQLFQKEHTHCIKMCTQLERLSQTAQSIRKNNKQILPTFLERNRQCKKGLARIKKSALLTLVPEVVTQSKIELKNAMEDHSRVSKEVNDAVSQVLNRCIS